MGDLARLYTLTTGVETRAEQLREAGERISNLARVLNIREGKGTRAHDTVPAKILDQPVSVAGVANDVTLSRTELDRGLDAYYAARGWTRNGVPTPATLDSLGLRELIPLVHPRPDVASSGHFP